MPATEEVKLPKHPGETMYGVGWLVQTLDDGRKIFSNGHFALVGDPPKGPIAKGCPGINALVKEIQKPPAAKVAVSHTHKAQRQTLSKSGKIRYEDWEFCVFDDSVAIDKLYHDFVLSRYPNVTWKHVPKFDLPVLCYDGETFVGCVMPVRL